MGHLGTVKLSEEQVAEIWRLHAAGGSVRGIAAEVSLDRNAVWRVLKAGRVSLGDDDERDEPAGGPYDEDAAEAAEVAELIEDLEDPDVRRLALFRLRRSYDDVELTAEQERRVAAAEELDGWPLPGMGSTSAVMSAP